MRKILLTTRSQFTKNLGTDVSYSGFSLIESDYIRFFETAGYYPVVVPNNTSCLDRYLKNCDMIVLTGGSDPIEEKNPRFIIEKALLEYAIKTGIPVWGICRGMQMINVFFGGSILKVKKHVGPHKIMITSQKPLDTELTEIIVNSFHNYGVTADTLASELSFFALAEDGVIEGLYHNSLKILGIQWHPERIKKLGEDFVEYDILNLLNSWMKKDTVEERRKEKILKQLEK